MPDTQTPKYKVGDLLNMYHEEHIVASVEQMSNGVYMYGLLKVHPYIYISEDDIDRHRSV